MQLRGLLESVKRVLQSSRLGVRMADEAAVPSAKKVKLERQFDFKKYSKRHILLMVGYLGWDYHGLVRQPEVEATVEEALCRALLTTKLIESIETANFRRCGRTDKGVSAFRQVVSLDIRSIAMEGEGVFIPEGYSPSSRQNTTPKCNASELNYISTLNRVLPSDVQALAWAPVPLDFSARYGCTQRTYKYFFPKGNLDIQTMQNAAQLLIGEHDFRNFCKLDLTRNSVKDTVRNVTSVSIEAVDPNQASTDSYAMYVLIISASSFLWHQIRNIVTVLVMIGQGREQPEVIASLLDVEACPRKPQYSPALETPLVFYDCVFENVKWRWDKEARRTTIARFQRQWIQLQAKAQIVKNMCDDLIEEAASDDPSFSHTLDVSGLLPGDRRRQHVPLLKRPTGFTLEELQVRHKRKREEKERRKSQSPVSDSESNVVA